MSALPSLRIGQGYDLHTIAPQRRMIIGGVEISTADNTGLMGHSDGDVLIHAIIDAIIGSMALGDIGQWFSDQDPAYAGADSTKLLLQVLRDPRLQGWQLINLDCTVIAQRPKLAPHILAIRHSIAQLLNVPVEQISVKAKTNEKCDAIGAGKAIAAWATLLASVSESPRQ